MLAVGLEVAAGEGMTDGIGDRRCPLELTTDTTDSNVDLAGRDQQIEHVVTGEFGDLEIGWRARAEVDDLPDAKQAKNIFTRFIEEAENAEQVEASDIDEAKAWLSEIDGLLNGESVEPVRVSNQSDSDSEPKGSRGLGIGLTVAGVAVLGSGIGMLAWGPTFVPTAEAQVAGLDDLGLPPGDPAFADGDEFIAAERRKGTAWMIGGEIAAAVGVVGLAFGIREIVRFKRSNPRAVAASASFGREGFGWGFADGFDRRPELGRFFESGRRRRRG